MKQLSTLFFLCMSLNSFAQTDSIKYQQLNAIFYRNTTNLSKAYTPTVFTIMDTSLENTLLSNTSILYTEISSSVKSKKISEQQAIEILIKQMLKNLRKQTLIHEDLKIEPELLNSFEKFNKIECNCLNKKQFSSTNQVNIMDAIKECQLEILNDTSFIKIRKNNFNKKFPSGFSKMEFQFFQYLYLNCNKIAEIFDDVVVQLFFLKNYDNVLDSAKKVMAKRLLIASKNNQSDSLAILFSNYTRFKNQLDTINNIIEVPNTELYFHYTSFSKQYPTTTITIKRKDFLIGTIKIQYQKPTISSDVQSIMIHQYQPPRSIHEGIEIRMDNRLPPKQLP